MKELRVATSVRLAAILLGTSCGMSALALADDRPRGPEEDGTKPALTRIAGEGFMNSRAYKYLTELSDDVGARVTGSAADRKAAEWASAKMKAIGLENVHLEKYTIWKGWTRGTAEAQLLSPTPHKLHVDAMGWTGSTVAGSGRRCCAGESFRHRRRGQKRCAAERKDRAGDAERPAEEELHDAFRGLRRFPESST